MGMQRVDETSIMDDEGNIYYMPAPKEAPSSDGVEGQQADLIGRIDANQFMARTAGQDAPPQAPPDVKVQTPMAWIPSIEGNTPEDKQIPEVNPLNGAVGGAVGPQGDGFRPKPPVTVKQARDQAIVNDLGTFSKQGGVLSSHEDVARAAGGVGDDQMQAEAARLAYERQQAERKAAKDTALAREGMRHAAVVQETIDRIEKESKARWEKWRHDDEEARKALVDPNHAMNTASTTSKAMWMLAFLGAGLQGNPASLKVVMEALDQTIQDDINAQKSNIKNRRDSIDKAFDAYKQQDAQDKSTLEENAKAYNLRMAAVEKALDARIAQMGAPAAEQAGLLKAKAAIGEKILETQLKVQGQIDQDKKAAQQHAYNMSLERLRHSNAISLKQMDIEADKEKRKEEREGQTIPLNTELGVHAVDKATGQAVTGSLRIKGSKDNAVKAGEILSAQNERYKFLVKVDKLIAAESDPDLYRGGSAKLKAAIKAEGMKLAKVLNGGRPTDKDFEIALFSEFGLEPDGTFAGAWRALRSPGAAKENARQVVQDHIRNLSEETENMIQPYIMDEDAQRFHITFLPTMKDVEAPSGKRTTDDTITAAAGGEDVSDLTSKPPRAPMTKEEADKLSAGGAYVAQYSMEKSQGKLPKLSDTDEAAVAQAIEEYQKRTPEDIIKVTKAYERNKSLSPEAKMRIKAEGAMAAAEARAIEREITSKEEATYKQVVKGQYGGDTKRIEAAWEAWQKTDKYKEMHKDELEKAGLVED